MYKCVYKLIDPVHILACILRVKADYPFIFGEIVMYTLLQKDCTLIDF